MKHLSELPPVGSVIYASFQCETYRCVFQGLLSSCENDRNPLYQVIPCKADEPLPAGAKPKLAYLYELHLMEIDALREVVKNAEFAQRYAGRRIEDLLKAAQEDGQLNLSL